MTVPELDEVEPLQRFVLLAVIELRHREDVPAHSFDVTRVCEDLLDEFDELSAVLPGGITRQRAITALNSLEEAGLLGKKKTESPTGKGRPAYALDIDEEGVLETLADDDRFADAVAHVRETRA
jgi:DNA-binding HxlR family transcriptional regulator